MLHTVSALRGMRRPNWSIWRHWPVQLSGEGGARVKSDRLRPSNSARSRCCTAPRACAPSRPIPSLHGRRGAWRTRTTALSTRILCTGSESACIVGLRRRTYRTDYGTILHACFHRATCAAQRAVGKFSIHPRHCAVRAAQCRECTVSRMFRSHDRGARKSIRRACSQARSAGYRPRTYSSRREGGVKTLWCVFQSNNAASHGIQSHPTRASPDGAA